ncbi:DUF6177 family protein [Myceligenerans crystallogenes]|uniref:DUF6177 family protein n=1 Tax=Myceligenerans crystallogenes TaxID=316335 RepID=A0ABP4ZIR5_9MICO
MSAEPPLYTARVRPDGTALPPAADHVAEGLLQNESRARVVALSEARSDLIHRTLPGNHDADATFALVTDERSVLTPVLADTIRSAGGVWVVRETGREGAGTLRDGFTGRRLRDLADGVAGAGRPAAELTAADLSPVFLRREPAALDPRVRDFPATRRLTLSVTVTHPARASTLLGGAAEILLGTILPGAGLTSWGTHEPALAPWDRERFTEYSRRFVDRGPHLVVVGDHALGTIRTLRTADGVEETTQLWIRGGAPGEPATAETLGRVPDALTLASRGGRAESGLALTRTTRADLNVPPVIEAPTLPLAMLIGDTALTRSGVPARDGIARFGGTLAGTRGAAALVLPLGDAAYSDWARMTEVLRWIGPRHLPFVPPGGQD